MQKAILFYGERHYTKQQYTMQVFVKFLFGLISCLIINQINSQLIKEGLMIRSSVPEEPTGETDCSTYVLSQDNK